MALSLTDYSDFLRTTQSDWNVTFARAQEYESVWASALEGLREEETKRNKQNMSPFRAAWPWAAQPGDSDYGHLFDLHDELAASLLVPNDALTDPYPRWPDMQSGIRQTIEAIGAMREGTDYSGFRATVQDTVESPSAYKEAATDAAVTIKLEVEKAADKAGTALAWGSSGLLIALVIVGGLYVAIATRNV